MYSGLAIHSFHHIDHSGILIASTSATDRMMTMATGGGEIERRDAMSHEVLFARQRRKHTGDANA